MAPVPCGCDPECCDEVQDPEANTAVCRTVLFERRPVYPARSLAQSLSEGCLFPLASARGGEGGIAVKVRVGIYQRVYEGLCKSPQGRIGIEPSPVAGG